MREGIGDFLSFDTYEEDKPVQCLTAVHANPLSPSSVVLFYPCSSSSPHPVLRNVLCADPLKQ
jgi:hypothetical protein